MREWLTVIIVLLIITVILDGLRRMRANRKTSLKMSLSMHQGTTKDDLDDYGSELPNGGARVIDVRDENHAEVFNKNLKEQHASKRKINKPYRIPQQVSLSLDEHVPMLMESVDDSSAVSSSASAESSKHEQASADNLPKQKSSKQKSSKKKAKKSSAKSKKRPVEPDLYDDLGMFDDGDRVEPKISFDAESEFDVQNKNVNKDSSPLDDTSDALNDELEDVLMTNSNYDASDDLLENHARESHEDEMDILREELKQERNLLADKEHGDIEKDQDDNEQSEITAGVKKETPVSPSLFDDTSEEINNELESLEDTQEYDDELDEEDYSEPEDVLVINVMAAKGEHFQGEELLNVVLSQGMRFGTMNIFHHHEDSENDGCILYSMANLVKPGTFDLNTMSEFSTPGVSLFMPLPLESDSLAAFEKMVATARAIAIQLYGDLKDENRSVFTKQTIEHYRSRIQEFERKYRLKSPA